MATPSYRCKTRGRTRPATVFALGVTVLCMFVFTGSLSRSAAAQALPASGADLRPEHRRLDYPGAENWAEGRVTVGARELTHKLTLRQTHFLPPSPGSCSTLLAGKLTGSDTIELFSLGPRQEMRLFPLKSDNPSAGPMELTASAGRTLSIPDALSPGDRFFLAPFFSAEHDELLAIRRKDSRLFRLSYDSAAGLSASEVPCALPVPPREMVAGDWDGDGIMELGMPVDNGGWLSLSFSEQGCSAERLPFSEIPETAPEMGLDTEGIGRDQPLTSKDNGKTWFIRGFTELLRTDPTAPWADFSDLAHAPRVAAGDFTGDGRDDLLYWTGSTVRGWWMALSQGSNGLELPLLSDFGLTDRPVRAVSAIRDVTGDGAEDILLQGEDCSAAVMTLSTGEALTSLSLRASGPEKEVLFPATLELSFLRILDSVEPGNVVLRPASRLLLRDAVTSGRLTLSVVPRAAVGEHAQAPLSEKPQGPFACIGYVPGARWKKWGRLQEPCPAGYAVLESDDAGEWRPGLDLSISATCCPLPSSQIVSGELFLAKGVCPDGAIAAGPMQHDPSSPERRLLCVRLAEGYELGPPESGRYWGAGHSMRGSGETLDKSALPAAVRVAIGRISLLSWDLDGCIGSSPDSVLVGGSGKGCSGATFRRIFVWDRGKEKLEAVQILPECQDIEDPLDPSLGCRAER